MTHLVSSVAATLMLAGVFAAPAAGQAGAPGKTVEAHGSKGMKGPDSHVKIDLAPNSANAKAVAPPSKGGPKSKGAAGQVHVDNRTNWYVNIYIDGAFRGTVEPWGDIYLYNACGSTTLYAKAPFDDGTYIYWGPTTDDFCSTTWTLRN
jgi:hypothetical protein